MPNPAESPFTLESFAALFHSESLRCIHHAMRKGWLSPVPESFLYYRADINPEYEYRENGTKIIVPAETIFTPDKLLPHLFRQEDCHFRRWIVVAPFAVTELETVMDVTIRDPTWTAEVITGESAYPHEPFQLSGPALPSSWRQGEPHPMVSLPTLQIGEIQQT